MNVEFVEFNKFNIHLPKNVDFVEFVEFNIHLPKNVDIVEFEIFNKFNNVEIGHGSQKDQRAEKTEKISVRSAMSGVAQNKPEVHGY